MRTPVFSFEAEILTDAPYAHVAERVRESRPEGFRSLRSLRRWDPLEAGEDQLVMRWRRSLAGTEESGALTIQTDPRGAHLRLEGRLKGWTGFLLLGWLRWRTDRLLDRFVEDL